MISTGISVKGCKTLSVTCGDSSPKGRAKRLHPSKRRESFMFNYQIYTLGTRLETEQSSS